jgi:hypothetical protein
MKKSYYHSWFIVALYSIPVGTFLSCHNEITISRDSIYSTSWTREGGYQGFMIAKITLLDTKTSIYTKDFDKYTLTRHVIDSGFCYAAGRNHNVNNIMPKIYFNQESKSFFWIKCGNLDDLSRKIGVLALNAWYLIQGIEGTADRYIYINKEGGSHMYTLGPTNF